MKRIIRRTAKTVIENDEREEAKDAFEFEKEACC